MTGKPDAGISERVEQLTAQLESLTTQRSPVLARPPGRIVDAIITGWEVNPRHGSGVTLIQHFGGDRDLLSIRAVDFFRGEQEFGIPLKIPHDNLARDAVFTRVAAALRGYSVRRILYIPFRPDDLANALAVRAISGAPMCTYVLDDQNIAFKGLDDALLKEALEKSSLRLGVSPEICSAYREKFGMPFHYMPPLAPAALIASWLCIPPSPPDARHAAMMGNIWSSRWMEWVRQTVRGSGVTISYPVQNWDTLAASIDDLRADGIHPQERMPEPDLIQFLRSMWFAVIPSGTMDDRDQDRRWMAEFSLPGRLIYLMCTSQIPVIVLGSRNTSAAHFVEQFGIGVVSDYAPGAFQDAVKHILRRDVNLGMRRRALLTAARFSAAGAGEWIWQSLERGEPYDSRFEDLLPAATQ